MFVVHRHEVSIFPPPPRACLALAASGSRELEYEQGSQRGQQNAQVRLEHGARGCKGVRLWARNDLQSQEEGGELRGRGGRLGAESSPAGRGAQRQHEPLDFRPGAEKMIMAERREACEDKAITDIVYNILALWPLQRSVDLPVQYAARLFVVVRVALIFPWALRCKRSVWATGKKVVSWRAVEKKTYRRTARPFDARVSYSAVESLRVRPFPISRIQRSLHAENPAWNDLASLRSRAHPRLGWQAHRLPARSTTPRKKTISDSV